MVDTNRRTAGVAWRRSWERAFAARLFWTDMGSIVLAVVGSQVIWFGIEGQTISWPGGPTMGVGYTVLSVVVIVVWAVMLDAFGSRDHSIIGSGFSEYRRVIGSTARLFGGFAVVAFLLKFELARGYFLTALPVGLALLIFTRWCWRQWLRRRQAGGTFVSRTLIVGDRKKSTHVAETIFKTEGSGLAVVGALTHEGSHPDLLPGIPVLGNYHQVKEAIARVNADTVILTGADDIGPTEMRQLGWDLDALDVSLIVAPALTDVAGPRIHARQFAGLPLIHVDFPSFEGLARFSKRMFDLIGSAVLIVLSLPVLVGVAIGVKATSPGAVLYQQERIGLRGKPFGMLKFRSMVEGADDQLQSLLDAQGTSDKPLFKINDDPRITPIGRFIRKYSLDEFPQLFNVFRGEMSLVGPRPQRAAEVALYDDAAHRRLHMKPGMSGLWQVSGRSNLSWDDAIRLDLYYVENWSVTADVVILWRTFRAIAASEGAV